MILGEEIAGPYSFPKHPIAYPRRVVLLVYYSIYVVRRNWLMISIVVLHELEDVVIWKDVEERLDEVCPIPRVVEVVPRIFYVRIKRSAIPFLVYCPLGSFGVYAQVLV